ncbi:hypothetical protein KEM54_005966 [Ascosphaera aggregata]|nr:hypothetical protein KEM54_005966 [Ascosphaera aggregata]
MTQNPLTLVPEEAEPVLSLSDPDRALPADDGDDNNKKINNNNAAAAVVVVAGKEQQDQEEDDDEDDQSRTQVDEFPSTLSTPLLAANHDYNHDHYHDHGGDASGDTDNDDNHSLSAVDAFAPPSLFLDADGDIIMGTRDRSRSKSPNRTPHAFSINHTRAASSIHSCPLRNRNRSLKSPLKKSSSFSTFNSSPDRFIPPRAPLPLDTSPYRLSKSPRHLPPNERRFRHRDPLNDPFTSPLRYRARSVPSRVEAFHTGSFPRSLPRYLTDEDPSAHGTPDGRPAGPPAVWRMQGSSSPRNFSPVGIEDGVGGFVSSGTGAPMFVADFLRRSTSSGNKRRHEARVAAALDIDQARRVVGVGREVGWDAEIPTRGIRAYEDFSWLGESEKERELTLKMQRASSPPTRSIPATPFRVLDAPLLRDDFYCTTLAYSPTAHAIAVGLGNRVYIWSETGGAESPPLRHQPVANYVTSLSFSSAEGGHSILAVGRQNGDVSLWSTFDDEVRFELALPHAVSCLAWRPSGAKKKLDLPSIPGVPAGAEELAIGDETGTVWYYAVLWTTPEEMKERKNRGQVILIAKIQAHLQQICGFAWSPDGTILATGGNDNRCLLFDIPGVFRRHVVEAPSRSTLSTLKGSGSESRSSEESHQRHHHCPLYTNLQAMYNSLSGPIQSSEPHLSAPRSRLTVGEVMATLVRSRRRSSLSNSQASNSPPTPPFKTIYIPYNRQKHTLHHSAAVKAISFAPWEPSLLATGGGSNDRCIHFYHAPSGSCLATINVHAQVTSVIWSRTRREIAATFGYAQPEHPYRIAVFAWPSCKQVVAIPWNSSGECGGRADSDANVECGRALWAISYPGGPNEIPGMGKDPRKRDGGDGKDTKSESGSHLRSPSHNRTSTSEESEPCLRVTARHGHKVPPIAVRAGTDQRGKDDEGNDDAGEKTGGQSKGKKKARDNGSSSNSGICRGYREGGRWWSRTAEEGCIVVVSSNERVNFHEVWSGTKKSTAGRSGMLGGSKILETLQGIEDEGGEVIR